MQANARAMSQERIVSPSGPRSPSSDPEDSAPQPTVSKKRKAEDAEDPSQDQLLDSGASTSDEYSTGRITCETCGQSVSFRDEQTGAYKVELWNAHKAQCSKPAQAPPEPTSALSIPEAVPTIDAAAAAPPAKRRRAKRTEEERIEYLRTDPYVAKFEAYRVLCASCDKWIRLRPNSTYCSIPWDAHRKSCLSKKGGSKVPTGPRDSALTNDPSVKKFDNDRVHCRYCCKWIWVGSDEGSVATWTKHRDACQQLATTPSTDSIPSVPPPSQQQFALVSTARPPSSTTSTLARPAQVPKDPKDDYATSADASASPSPSFKTSPLASTSTSASTHVEAQARRRNAEQRAALLRNDPLLSEVEPHRVFCGLCKKWVQLRQDSSYCAYPWQQHRAKCVLRTERKAQKARARAGGFGAEHAVDTGDEGSPGEEGTGNSVEGSMRDMPMDVDVADPTPRHGRANGRSLPTFADLDNDHGRVAFVLQSVSYLFATTYESTDDMTIASLVLYLNSAMPPDKYVDFDTCEVVDAVRALDKAGKLALSGDLVRLL